MDVSRRLVIFFGSMRIVKNKLHSMQPANFATFRQFVVAKGQDAHSFRFLVAFLGLLAMSIRVIGAQEPGIRLDGLPGRGRQLALFVTETDHAGKHQQARGRMELSRWRRPIYVQPSGRR